jgi:enoyl-CoA hydratase/carnithine racemase
MTEGMVKLRIEGELAYLVLNRPEKRNAIGDGVLDALIEAATEAEASDARAIILSGEGVVFSAGVDFSSLSGAGSAGAGGKPSLARFRRSVARSQAALNLLESIEKPVIGAIHGYAGGLGLELALACDARIAAAGTKLGMPEVRLGLIPDVGGTTRLTRTVGYAKAKELIMTARMIEANEAERIGLVNKVVPVGQQIAGAEELAREMARNAPLAVGMAKKVIDRGYNVDKMTFMDFEAIAQSSLLLTEDFYEGANAAAQRRDPKFRGR